MMADHSISARIEFTPGTPEFGGWCDHCFTPSVVKTPLYVITKTGVVSFGAVTKCMNEEHDYR